MGNELFKKITESTGLPVEIVSKKLERLLQAKGLDAQELTLEELRNTLSDFLKEVILESKEAFEQGVIMEEEADPNTLGE